MELDLSDVLGGGGGDQSLNTDLAATTPAGDSVFSAPFGAATAFRTPNGKAVRVAFVFDPQAAYDETAIVASIEKDYMAAVREGLTRALLKPDEIAQRVSTEEETVLASIRKALPTEVLSDLYFAEKENLDKYVAMIDRRAREAYREEITLGERLKTENFRFAFKIAIDAFLNKNVENKSHRRKGVLTIRIDGGDHAVASLALTATKPEEKPVTAERSPKPARKGGDPASQASMIEKADRKEVEELTEALQLHNVEGMIEKKEKDFPDSTDDFFNAITSWFGTVVATRARKLEEGIAQKMPLYN